MHFVLFPSPSEVRIVTHNHMDHTGLSSPDGAWIVTDWATVAVIGDGGFPSPDGAWIVTQLCRKDRQDIFYFRPLTGRGL